MFDSLLKTAAKAASSSATKGLSPARLVEVAQAMEIYQHERVMVISDAIIEARFQETLRDVQAVQEVAIHGFRDHLRLTAVVEVQGIPIEVLFSIRAQRVAWGSTYELDFLVVFERWHHLSAVGAGAQAFTKGFLKGLLSSAIPFGGLVADLGSLAASKAVERTGMATIKADPKLQDAGVTWSGDVACLDLRQIEDLKPLFSSPPFVPDELAAVAGPLSVPSRAADLLFVTDVSADARGLILNVELSPVAEKVMRVLCRLGQHR